MRRITVVETLTLAESEVTDANAVRFYVGDDEYIEIRHSTGASSDVIVTSGRMGILTIHPKASNMIAVKPEPF